MPALRFPPELPISARVHDIATAIDGHQVVIVAGATGSGKTTQLPKIALAMGRGLEKIIGVTQPRRIAATSVAARVASELGSPLGTDVGYQVRFDDRTSPSTYVKFMTDGILLAEIQGDRLLRRYDTLVIDEAHERSLTIDFLLGWLARILPERPDLKVIVSSATLETDRFSDFFGGAPVIEVEGRTYPVDVLYEPPADDADLPDAVASAIENVTSLDPRGDILVFLPGERDIDALAKQYGARARAAWKKTAPSPKWERAAIKTWDFGELAPFVVRQVGSVEVRSYPALVDRDTSVDLVLLETAAAAEAASRAGVRRLFTLAARQTISSIAPRLPAALTRPGGAMPSRAETDAFRAMLLARIVDAAFDLENDAPLPRSKAAFEERLKAGAVGIRSPRSRRPCASARRAHSSGRAGPSRSSRICSRTVSASPSPSHSSRR